MRLVLLIAVVLVLWYQYSHKLVTVGDVDEATFGALALNLIKI